jgi:hypothetical protein
MQRTRAAESDFDAADEDGRAYYGAEPPAVPESDLPIGTVQLNVQVVRAGRPTELGQVAANATLTDIVTTFRSAMPNGGTLWLTPINMTGKQLRSQPFVKDVDPHHEVYRLAAPQQTVTALPGSPGTFVVNPVAGQGTLPTSIVEAVTASARARESSVDKREAALAAREDELRSQEERLHRLRLGQTEDLSTKSWEAQNRVYERAAQKENESNKALIDFMAAQNAAASAAFERQVAAIAAQNAATTAMLTTFLTASATAEKDRATQAIADAEARAARSEKEHAEKMERDRAYNDQVLERIRKQADADAEVSRSKRHGNPLADAIGMFGPVLTLMKTMGIEPKELFQGLISGGAGGSMLDAGARIAEKMADTMIELKKLDLEYGAEAAASPDGGKTEMVKLKFPDGTERIMPAAEARQIMEQAQAHALQQQQQVQAQQQQRIPQQTQQAQNTGAHLGQNTPAGFVAPKGPPPKSAAAPVSTKALVTGQLDARQAKAARMAAGIVADAIGKNAHIPDDSAFGMAVLQALAERESPELEAYVRLNGLAPVLREAGAFEASIARIVALIRILQSQNPPAFDADIPMEAP